GDDRDRALLHGHLGDLATPRNTAGGHERGHLGGSEAAAQAVAERGAESAQSPVAEAADADAVEAVEPSDRLDERLHGAVGLAVDVEPSIGERPDQLLEQR